MTMSGESGKRPRLAAPERRRQLLEAARVAYLSRGLAATGKDIAAVAGINEALIYRHFDSKEALLAEAATESLEQLFSEAMARERNHPPYEEGGYDEMREFVARILRLLLDSAPILGVQLFSEKGPEFYRKQIAPTIDGLAVALDEDPDPAGWNLRDFPRRLLVTMLWGTCLGLAIDARFRSEELDVDGTAGEIASLIFEGLIARTDLGDGTGRLPMSGGRSMKVVTSRKKPRTATKKVGTAPVKPRTRVQTKVAGTRGATTTKRTSKAPGSSRRSVS